MSDLALALGRVRRALVRRHVARVLLGAGVVLATVWAGGAFLAWSGALSAVRWAPAAFWAGALAGFALTVRAALGAARRARLDTLRGAATLVEAEQGLRRGSLVGLVDAAGEAPAGTSAALLAAHTRRVVAGLPEPSPGRWTPRAWAAAGSVLRRRGLALAAAVALAAVGFALAGDAALVLASPLRAVRAGLRSAVGIAVSASRVRRGGEVVVTVSAPGSARAALYLREPGQAWRPVVLNPDAAGRATQRLRDLQATVHLFASAGGASSDTLTVTVLQPPVLADFGLTATYPAYLAREQETLPADAGPLALPVGTVLRVQGLASAPLARAAFAGPAGAVPLEVSGPRLSGRFVVRTSGTWHLYLEDLAGQAVPEPLPVLEVRAVPDSAPVVAVTVPGADTTAPLDLKQGLVIEARDDHALGRVEIVSRRVSRLGVGGAPVVDTLPGVAGADRVVLAAVLDLTERGLLPGDTLRYLVRALDQAPMPHVGTSREFALRLRSMAELREAVRGGADSLARDAESLAGDQGSLARRTEDLAARRPRQGETPAAAGGDSAARRPAGPDQMSFEQAQEAGRIREEQAALVQRAEQLRRDLAGLARSAVEAGLNDPAWQQQLKDLDDLLRQAITPELAQRMEELRRALERLDPEAVRQALARLAQSQRDLRQELERSRELFERAAVEGSLQTMAADADALQRAEQQWAARAPEQRDSSAAAAQQRALARDLDSLAGAMRDLQRRMRERGDSGTAAVLGRQDARAQEADRAMEAAGQQMDAGRRPDAGAAGQRAAQALQPMAQQLRDRQREVSAGWRTEVMQLLQDAMNETVTLAVEQQRLAREVREGSAGPAEARGREGALQQGVGQVMRRLGEAAGRNALVSPRLGASLARAQRQMEESRRSLEGQRPAPDAASAQAEEAARSLSGAAMELARNRETVAGAQSGSGLAEALRQMAELANQQGQLTDQAGGLFPMLGSGDAVALQLRAMAARQRAIADRLERLSGSDLPGHPEQLAREARDLAERLEAGRLDRATLERQQRLFRRMLDAGRTLRNEDDDREPERRSQTAREGPVAAPAARRPGGTGLRYPLPAWEALKGLTSVERAMVLDYFRRLNAVAP